MIARFSLLSTDDSLTHPFSILKTLKDFGKDRRHKQGAEQKKEETEWKELWKGLGHDLLLHASKKGSTDALQIILDTVQDCNLHLYV